jgi:hypothetical protein
LPDLKKSLLAFERLPIALERTKKAPGGLSLLVSPQGSSFISNPDCLKM